MVGTVVEPKALPDFVRQVKHLRRPMIVCVGNGTIPLDSFGPKVYELLRMTHLKRKVELLPLDVRASSQRISVLERKHDLIVVDAGIETDARLLGKIEVLRGSYIHRGLHSEPFGKLWIILITIASHPSNHFLAPAFFLGYAKGAVLEGEEIDAMARTVASALVQVFPPTTRRFSFFRWRGSDRKDHSSTHMGHSLDGETTRKYLPEEKIDLVVRRLVPILVGTLTDHYGLPGGYEDDLGECRG